VILHGQRMTKRQREVLRLIAEGKSNKEIAAKLRITERTVKFHVASILNRLDAENRAQAVAMATERHLI
jgi:DNA-binding NarL/FixJ family response regulator